MFVDYDNTVLDNKQTVILRIEEGSFFMNWDLCSMYHQLSLFFEIENFHETVESSISNITIYILINIFKFLLFTIKVYINSIII